MTDDLNAQIQALQEDIEIWKRIAIEYIKTLLLVEDGKIPDKQEIEREIDFAWQDAMRYPHYGSLNVLGSGTLND